MTQTTEEPPHGMPCHACSSGSHVTHTYRIDGGLVIVRRRQCLVCRLVWHSQETRLLPGQEPAQNCYP